MSDMPGQREFLSVCFSCLRYSRLGASVGVPLVRPASLSNAFLNAGSDCRQCRLASSSMTGSESGKNQGDLSIDENPFYEKYKDKLKHLSEEDPEEFKARVEKLKDQKSPKKEPTKAKIASRLQETAASADSVGDVGATPQPIPRSTGFAPSKGLDSVMKLELIQGKSAAEVEQIWKDYHKTKDCVFAVLQKDAFEDLMTKANSCPTFILPLPKNEGHEFILLQFDGKDVQFTPLAMYQILRENSPPCLSLVHYIELMDDKGIVLMSGQYDDKVLKREDAVMLVQMMAIYYGKNSSRFHHVQTFNHQPAKFDHNALIQDYNSLYMGHSTKVDA